MSETMIVAPIHGVRGGRTPTCGHPERPHAARGMCASCYTTWRRQTKGRTDAHYDKCGRDPSTVVRVRCPRCLGQVAFTLAELPHDPYCTLCRLELGAIDAIPRPVFVAGLRIAA